MTGHKRIIDLSHDIHQGMLIHPWMPQPIVSDYVSREQSAKFLAGQVSFQQVHVTLAGSTGTILQVPFQFYAEGDDIAAFPLARLIDVPIVLIRVVDRPEAVTPDVFDGHEDLTGKAVLFHTGQDQLWGTDDYFENTCFLADETVKYLVEARPAVVGVDSKNTDNGADQGKPAQHELLGVGAALLTSLTRLREVPERGATLTVLPAPMSGMGSFPVRPVALVDA